MTAGRLRHVLACVALAFLAGACCDVGSEPPPPYGEPDDTIRASSRNGWASVTFIYHCIDGKYVTVTYERPEECAEYERRSVIESDGLCSTPVED